ncbi:hypothetical protein CBR_g6469 [Chara braunii]|uniref:Uncharacterized protein n=1 Tax=Chara braunii TaxID=69332 RepID=A0A388KJW3_CHABU|nr:hypothetical protein CBR_g6469 [Chara braunii]|eukprot:GBG70341.1 hypothetical protein CBR_g6469 [Chara braunii]
MGATPETWVGHLSTRLRGGPFEAWEDFYAYSLREGRTPTFVDFQAFLEDRFGARYAVTDAFERVVTTRWSGSGGAAGLDRHIQVFQEARLVCDVAFLPEAALIDRFLASLPLEYRSELWRYEFTSAPQAYEAARDHQRMRARLHPASSSQPQRTGLASSSSHGTSQCRSPFRSRPRRSTQQGRHFLRCFSMLEYALWDSGSQGDFIHPRVVKEARLPTTGSSTLISVTLGDDKTQRFFDQTVTDLPFFLTLEPTERPPAFRRHRSSAHFDVMETGYDFILGTPWSRRFRSTEADWATNTLVLKTKCGQTYRKSGCQPALFYIHGLASCGPEPVLEILVDLQLKLSVVGDVQMSLMGDSRKALPCSQKLAMISIRAAWIEAGQPRAVMGNPSGKRHLVDRYREFQRSALMKTPIEDNWELAKNEDKEIVPKWTERLRPWLALATSSDEVWRLAMHFYERWESGRLLATDGVMHNKKKKGSVFPDGDPPMDKKAVGNPAVSCWRQMGGLTDDEKASVLRKVLSLEVVWVQSTSEAVKRERKLLGITEAVFIEKCDRMMLPLFHYIEFDHEKRPEEEWEKDTPIFRPLADVFEEFEEFGLDQECWTGWRIYFTDHSYVNLCPQLLGGEKDNDLKRTKKLVEDSRYPMEFDKGVTSVLENQHGEVSHM